MLFPKSQSWVENECLWQRRHFTGMNDHHRVYFSTADKIKQTLPPDRVSGLPCCLSRHGLLTEERSGLTGQGSGPRASAVCSCVKNTEHRGRGGLCHRRQSSRMRVSGCRAVAPLIIRPAGGGGVSPRRYSEQPARLFLNMSPTRRSTLNPRQDKFTAK